MGHVRVERISLRDERSHSEGIRLASERRTVSAAPRLLAPWKNLVDLNEDLLLRGNGKKKTKENKERGKKRPASGIRAI